MIKEIRLKLFLLVLLFIVSLFRPLYAATLDNWNNPDAYKPDPILFLHGFGLSTSESWTNIKSELNKYFNDYGEGALSFLEAINFNDPNGSSTI